MQNDGKPMKIRHMLQDLQLDAGGGGCPAADARPQVPGGGCRGRRSGGRLKADADGLHTGWKVDGCPVAERPGSGGPAACARQQRRMPADGRWWKADAASSPPAEEGEGGCPADVRLPPAERGGHHWKRARRLMSGGGCWRKAVGAHQQIPGGV